ncbi:uncharacterized protein MKK02DRAFT_30017 [Dioszegia hungarica]|uniref:Uncharacterized protein n=1 Tax=Dioszegia hungarica TaxID=4972 RepID=A0AA38H2I2_9TREE|nr:uncharacterized protein MKK02DRAFT_30017 [Dioszegia hungarica]KAI9633038.1 hypothetical protein MKK02DRAFT_30017 [Dioszegia hungarica]
MAVILFDGKVVERLAFGLWTGVHIVNTMNERHGKEVWSCPLAFPAKGDVGPGKKGIGLITVKLYYGSLTPDPERVEAARAVSASGTVLDKRKRCAATDLCTAAPADRSRKSTSHDSSLAGAGPSLPVRDTVSVFEYRDSATRHFHEFSIRYCNRDVLDRELAKDDAAQATKATSSSALRTVAGAPARPPRVRAKSRRSNTNAKPRTPKAQVSPKLDPLRPRSPPPVPEPVLRPTPSPEPGPASLPASPAVPSRAEQSPSPSLSPYPTPAGSPAPPLHETMNPVSQDVKFTVDMSIPDHEPANAASGSSVPNPPSSASRKRPRRSSSARSDLSSSSSSSSSFESDAGPPGGTSSYIPPLSVVDTFDTALERLKTRGLSILHDHSEAVPRPLTRLLEAQGPGTHVGWVEGTGTDGLHKTEVMTAAVWRAGGVAIEAFPGPVPLAVDEGAVAGAAAAGGDEVGASAARAAAATSEALMSASMAASVETSSMPSKEVAEKASDGAGEAARFWGMVFAVDLGLAILSKEVLDVDVGGVVGVVGVESEMREKGKS